MHALIDCGTLGATTTGVKMADVVQNIADETGSHLHLLVATHEHKDHVSGFNSERERFDRIAVDHVWLAWTEDGGDALAREVAKYKDDVLTSVALAAHALAGDHAAAPGDRPALAEMPTGARLWASWRLRARRPIGWPAAGVHEACLVPRKAGARCLLPPARWCRRLGSPAARVVSAPRRPREVTTGRPGRRSLRGVGWAVRAARREPGLGPGAELANYRKALARPGRRFQQHSFRPRFRWSRPTRRRAASGTVATTTPTRRGVAST